MNDLSNHTFVNPIPPTYKGGKTKTPKLVDVLPSPVPKNIIDGLIASNYIVKCNNYVIANICNSFTFLRKACATFCKTLKNSGEACASFCNSLTFFREACASFCNSLTFFGEACASFCNSLTFFRKTCASFCNSLTFFGEACASFCNSFTFFGEACATFCNNLSKILNKDNNNYFNVKHILIS